MKRALLVVLLLLAVVAPAGASVRDLVDRGVVQSIGPTQIVLRGLDGSTLTFSILPRTRITLNGLPAATSSILPGFSAVVVHGPAGRASAVRAFGKPRAVTQIDKGVIVSVSRSLIVLRQTDGALVSISVGAQTSVILNDLPSLLSDLKPGYLAAVLHVGAQPAREVRALRR